MWKLTKQFQFWKTPTNHQVKRYSYKLDPRFFNHGTSPTSLIYEQDPKADKPKPDELSIMFQLKSLQKDKLSMLKHKCDNPTSRLPEPLRYDLSQLSWIDGNGNILNEVVQVVKNYVKDFDGELIVTTEKPPSTYYRPSSF